MHFCIDADDGDCVRGWVAPNNPGSIPKIVLVRPGQSELVLEANVMRAGIRDLGLHDTGQVGFAIGADIVPNIAELDEFSLLESERRLPIFHRNRTGADLPHKLCLFDTTAINSMHGTIERHFNLAYFNTESIPLETMMVIINNKFTDSIFMHGRTSVFRYNAMLDEAEFKKAALLTDPFVDLSARLMGLQIVSQTPNGDPRSVGLHGFECVIPLANALPFDDPKGMAAAFRHATPQQIQALSNPMTRLFACDPHEQALHRHVSMALETLSTLDLVGTRERFDVFSETLSGLLGEDIFDGRSAAMPDSIYEVARSLSQIKFVKGILESDVILYSWAEQAIVHGVQIARF
jgi:hypothetical protein